MKITIKSLVLFCLLILTSCNKKEDCSIFQDRFLSERNKVTKLEKEIVTLKKSLNEEEKFIEQLANAFDKERNLSDTLSQQLIEIKKVLSLAVDEATVGNSRLMLLDSVLFCLDDKIDQNRIIWKAHLSEGTENDFGAGKALGVVELGEWFLVTLGGWQKCSE